MQKDYISFMESMSRENVGTDFINVPFFIIGDSRWNRIDSLLIGFFISLHKSSKNIQVSNKYLSNMLDVDERSIRRSILKITEFGVIECGHSANIRSISLSYPFMLAAKIKDYNRNKSTNEPGQCCPPPPDNLVHPPGQCCPNEGVDSLLYYIKEYNIPEKKVSLKKELKREKNTQEDKCAGFDVFWKLYPNKKTKKKSLEIWKRKKLYLNHVEICKKLSVQVKFDFSKREVKFIPHPSTYLNNERWDDEVTEKEKHEVQIRPVVPEFNPNRLEDHSDGHEPLVDRYLREHTGEHSTIDPSVISGPLTGICGSGGMSRNAVSNIPIKK